MIHECGAHSHLKVLPLEKFYKDLRNRDRRFLAVQIACFVASRRALFNALKLFFARHSQPLSRPHCQRA
jgi:hypothetical protein